MYLSSFIMNSNNCSLFFVYSYYSYYKEDTPLDEIVADVQI